MLILKVFWSSNMQRIFYLLLWGVALPAVLMPNATATNFRTKRSIKDALPKDDEFSHSRAILDMRHKVFNLESSVKNIDNDIYEMSNRNKILERTVLEQKSEIEKLDEEIHSLTETLSGHAGTIKDLTTLASTDENLFALSNQTCGGVLVGQSGSIVFTNSALRGTRFPSTCIWTIRANNRGKIKITAQQASRGYSSYSSRTSPAVVVEIVAKNGTNDTTSVSNLETKVTRLERNMHHIFDGPVVYVVYVLTSYQNDDYADIDLQLHYEGLGKLTNKEVYYSHESLHQNSGRFDYLSMESWKSPVVNENVTYTNDYSTIVVSNFSTKVHLQAEFTEACRNDSSFIVVTDLLEKNAIFTDCCKQSCTGKNSLINYDNPFVILITKKFQSELKFGLTWEAETPYPSSSQAERLSAYSSSYKCGEVLGGTSGSILYKPHLSYRNGERCIWAIVPQPRPRASISINVGANGVETTYDHLYMVELTDVNGTLLEDAPKITRLGRYGTYEANSREVYVVFYSDSSVTGYGFSLSWRASGEFVKTGGDVTTKFTLLKQSQGEASSFQVTPFLTNSLYQVFLLTPTMPYSYVFGMQLHINQTQPRPEANGCLHEDISLYMAVDGVLTKPNMEEICSAQTEPGKVALEDADGLGMIVLNNRNPDAHVAFNFSWREEYGAGNSTYVTIDSTECGGVIKGEKGVLKYKIGADYQNNERCVWLLQTPNYSSITLKLLKDGFEPCCDHILVNTIDPDNGTLRNDTTIINRANRTRTFNESVLVLVFRSDASTRGRGFALQFAGNEESTETPGYRYQLSHHNEPFGSVAYPSSDWEDPEPGVKDIFIIGSSLRVGVEEESLSMPTNLSFTSGVFKKDSDCSYESITFYTTPDPDGWVLRQRFPNENATETCDASEIRVDNHPHFCNTVYSAFLAIYRHLPTTEDEEENEMRMGFTFEKSAGCGGILIGDTGEISYKEDGKYANSEKCIWLVQAPQAKKIRFVLERSGFEACCDLIYIHSISTYGQAVPAGVIAQGNRTLSVEGPVAIVVFTSDSSVTGDGFRLTFFTETNITEPFLYTYHLEHRNQPRENQFQFNVDENAIVVAAYSPEVLRQIYQGTGKTKITIAAMRPQIDLQCNSDSLVLYDVFGSDKGLVASKQFNVKDLSNSEIHERVNSEVIEHGNCTQLENSLFTNCNIMTDCGDVPTENVLYMNTTSFVAVYKSANVTSGDLQLRGLLMVSYTNYSRPGSSVDE